MTHSPIKDFPDYFDPPLHKEDTSVCIYARCAHIVTGTEDNYKYVRNTLIEYMRLNRDVLQSVFDDHPQLLVWMDYSDPPLHREDTSVCKMHGKDAGRPVGDFEPVNPTDNIFLLLHLS